MNANATTNAVMTEAAFDMISSRVLKNAVFSGLESVSD